MTIRIFIITKQRIQSKMQLSECKQIKIAIELKQNGERQKKFEESKYRKICLPIANSKNM